MADTPNVIGNYQLGEVLGRGAFAAVFKGLNVLTGDLVAVKMLKISKIKSAQLQGIMSEVDLMQRLDHQNIVQYLDCHRQDQWLGIVIEYVEGGSLQSLQKKFGNPSEELVSRYISQVLQGLAYLHEQGVVHRDIKGANILTTKQGLVKLADFGVATSQLKESEVNVAGTPYWMAPEIIELAGATFASDIWSVGCTIIELLTGSPPYYDLAPMSALFRIVQDDCPPFPAGISGPLRDFLQLCFQKDPNLRRSASELLLHRWIKGKAVIQAVPKVSAPASVAAASASTAPGTTSNSGAAGSPASLRAGGELDGDSAESDEGSERRSRGKKKDREATKTLKKSKDRQKDRESRAKIGTSKRDKTIKLKGDKKKGGSRKKSHKRDTERPRRRGSSDEELGFDDDELPGESTPGRNASHHKDRNAGDKEGLSHPANSEAAGAVSLTAVSAASESEEDDFFADFDVADDAATVSKPAKAGPKLILPGKFAAGAADLPLEMDFSSDSEDAKLSLAHASNQGQGEAAVSSAAHGNEDANRFVEASDDEFSAGFELEDASSDAGDNLFEKKLVLVAQESSPAIEVADLELSDEDDELETDSVAVSSQAASTINSMVQDLVNLRDEDKFVELCASLADTIKRHSREKSYWIRHHGVVALMEIFDQKSERCLYSMLLVVNQMIADNTIIRENLCLIGGLPTIMRLASMGSSFRIRQEAAQFLREMFTTSTMTLQMFIACNGINVLVQLMEYCVLSADALGRKPDENFQVQPDEVTASVAGYSFEDVTNLAHICIEGVYQILFKLKDSKLPRNDFCRLLVRTGLPEPLSQVLRLLQSTPKSTEADVVMVMDIIGVLAVQDSVVKLGLAKPVVLTRLLNSMVSLPIAPLTQLLRALKALTADSRTLPLFTEVNAVRRLAELKDRPESQLQNTLLPCFFNLCRIDRGRQSEAVAAGLIPYFLSVFHNNGAQKQFAIQILCELAHNRDAHAALWDQNGAEAFIDILRKEIKTTWPRTVLESLSAWFSTEGRLVDVLVDNVDAIVDAVIMHASYDALETLTRVPTRFLTALAHSRILDTILDYSQLKLMNPLARIAAMKIIQTITKSADLPPTYFRDHDLGAKVRVVYTSDNSVVVRRLCKYILDQEDGKPKKERHSKRSDEK